MLHSVRAAALAAAAILMTAPPAALPAAPRPQARAATPGALSARPRGTPTPFVATYSVSWHGIGAGTSTLGLERTAAADEYRYTSTIRADGLFRLVFPHPVRQSSRFRVAGGQVTPLAFESSGAGQNVMVQFDWKTGEVTGTAKGKLLDRRLHPGTQDPLSVQIALMLALEAGQPPDAFWMLDTDEIARFAYVRRGTATLDTPLGALATVLYTSHAHGSDRTTWLWLAPALDYMPARAEQRIKGRTQLTLEILSFIRR
jgi:hypothetical protein